MLTIQVDDARLEQQIEQRAQATGQGVEQLIRELLTKTFDNPVMATLWYTRLDPANYRNTLQFDVDPLTDDAPVFQHVGNSTEFANQLRRDAWKR